MHTRLTLLGGGLALLGAACAGVDESPTAPPSAILVFESAPPSQPSSDTLGLRPSALRLVAENANLCSYVGPQLLDGKLQYIQGTLRIPQSPTLVVSDDGADAFGEVRYIKWNKATGDRVIEARCVVALLGEGPDNAVTYLRAMLRGDLAKVELQDGWEKGSSA